MTKYEIKPLILGTALWGWTIEKRSAYDILDTFISYGGRYIDTATNYPINKRTEDMGLSLLWLKEWLKINGSHNVEVILKVGSVDNSGSSKSQMSGGFLEEACNQYSGELDGALSVLSTHWDHDDDPIKIVEIINAFRKVLQQGFKIGLSGIRHPKIYYENATDLADKWWIQVKENVFDNSARARYQQFFMNSKYIAYGINLGGIKPSGAKRGRSSEMRNILYPAEVVHSLEQEVQEVKNKYPYVDNLYKYTLFHALMTKDLGGIIIGPSKVAHLIEVMNIQHEMIADGTLR